MISPATHPPCNAENSCELIKSEIKRSCELFQNDTSVNQYPFCFDYVLTSWKNQIDPTLWRIDTTAAGDLNKDGLVDIVATTSTPGSRFLRHKKCGTLDFFSRFSKKISNFILNLVPQLV